MQCTNYVTSKMLCHCRQCWRSLKGLQCDRAGPALHIDLLASSAVAVSVERFFTGSLRGVMAADRLKHQNDDVSQDDAVVS